MGITSAQALEIAIVFHDASKEIGDYRLNNFQELSEANRQELENYQWDLLNYSSSFVTKAVGIILNNMQADLDAITTATQEATRVVHTINRVKDVIKAATALVELGGAIISRDPVAIINKASQVINIAQGILGGPAPVNLIAASVNLIQIPPPQTLNRPQSVTQKPRGAKQK